jgi:glycosyltransferase involved in cell wall biosynthesis
MPRPIVDAHVDGYLRCSQTRRMKILHVTASYLPAVRYGGTIVSVHGLCRALVDRGHEVHVYTTSVDGDRDSDVLHDTPVNVDGVTVWYFRSTRLRRLYWSPPLRRMLRNHIREFEIVHTHAIYLWPLWTAARIAQQAGVPHVVSPRGMLEKELIEQRSTLWKAGLIGFIERRTLEQAAAVHTTSVREREQLDAFGFHVNSISVIPNGVTTEAAPAGRVSEAVNDVARGGPFALYLGRVNWKKGLDRLISAMPHAGEVRLIIAGNDEEEYTPQLIELARQSGVGDRVVFTGPVHGADKAALLAAARVLVLPSYSENFGNVVVEAMATGCPVVVTREVGIGEAVDRIGAGVVVDGTAAELGGAIAAIATDERRRFEMGARGRAAALSEFSWPVVAAQMEALYQSVLARRAMAHA